MANDEVRDAVETLVRDALHAIHGDERGVAYFAGATPVYSTARDDAIRRLESFDVAKDSVVELPLFIERFGADAGDRIALQFVYQYLVGLEEAVFDEARFATVYASLNAEIADPDWTYVHLANLRHFTSNDPLIDFGDGLTIRHRDFDELHRQLGWGDWELQQLTDDWMAGFGSSEHIVYVEEKVPKTPENLILSGTATGPGRVARLLQALWLYKVGDVQIGKLFAERAARFVRIGGLTTHGGGPVSTAFGTAYNFAASEAPEVRHLLDQLQNLEKNASVPGNVALALRRFSAIYGRGTGQREDRILDAITALEALLGSEDELTFKLSYRVASILAADDDERVELFASLKGFYRTRSRIVHGLVLRAKDLELVQDDTPLRDVARRLLRGGLNLVDEDDFLLVPKYVNEELDKVLLHEGKRQKLREAMGLAHL
jgi:hypothetical protein